MARKITRGKNGVTYYNGVTGRKKAISLLDILTILPQNKKKTSSRSKKTNDSSNVTHYSPSLQSNNDSGCGCIFGALSLFAIVLLIGISFVASLFKTSTSGSRHHHHRRHRRYTMINYNIEKQLVQNCYYITTKNS